MEVSGAGDAVGRTVLDWGVGCVSCGEEAGYAEVQIDGWGGCTISTAVV